jgi:hypothetical protein
MKNFFYLISVALCMLVFKTEARNFHQTDNGIRAEINKPEGIFKKTN